MDGGHDLKSWGPPGFPAKILKYQRIIRHRHHQMVEENGTSCGIAFFSGCQCTTKPEDTDMGRGVGLGVGAGVGGTVGAGVSIGMGAGRVGLFHRNRYWWICRGHC